MPFSRSTYPQATWRARARRLALAPIALGLLNGCSSTPVATVEPFRTTLRDVCIARGDVLTENTAQQIEANNLALRRMLKRGSQCPKPSGKPALAKEEPSTS